MMAITKASVISSGNSERRRNSKVAGGALCEEKRRNRTDGKTHLCGKR